jgi:archaellum component FlaF (FlaF/FlaG flagellin family)
MMKKLLVFFGLSLFSSTAFSQQQISNARKPIAAAVPEKVSTSEELVSDSTAVSTMKRTINRENKEIPVSNGTGANREQTPIVNSTRRKPE